MYIQFSMDQLNRIISEFREYILYIITSGDTVRVNALLWHTGTRHQLPGSGFSESNHFGPDEAQVLPSEEE
jgi:hypothetical protein